MLAAERLEIFGASVIERTTTIEIGAPAGADPTPEQGSGGPPPADSVSIPVIMDGDTGHGGIMVVRRMVRERIRAGVAGIRIDDQGVDVNLTPLSGWFGTWTSGDDVAREMAMYRIGTATGIVLCDPRLDRGPRRRQL
ncbi:MAG: hypothetical protein ACREE9_03705 [Stellaceae bacterium]